MEKGSEKGPGSVQYWEIQKAAEPVREMASRVMELLPQTRAGQAFVREKLGGLDLGRLQSGMAIRCKDVGKLQEDLAAELGGQASEGALGGQGEQGGEGVGESADSNVPEVIGLIEKLRVQFAAIREYHEKIKGPVGFDFFVQQYDEMMGKGIYPDLTFFNSWEERACRTYDDYEGVLTRMTECGHVAGIRFLSAMLGICGSAEQVKRVVSYVNNSNCGLRDHLLGVFSKWVRMNAVGCGEGGCKSLRDFFDELVATSGGPTASPWTFYRMSLEQNIRVAHENVSRWRRGSNRARGSVPNWLRPRVGDPKSQGRKVEVIVKGKGPVDRY